MLPHFIARAHPDLEIVLPQEVELKRHYWLVCHRDLHNVPRVRTVADHIGQTVEANLDLFLKPASHSAAIASSARSSATS